MVLGQALSLVPEKDYTRTRGKSQLDLDSRAEDQAQDEHYKGSSEKTPMAR